MPLGYERPRHDVWYRRRVCPSATNVLLLHVMSKSVVVAVMVAVVKVVDLAFDSTQSIKPNTMLVQCRQNTYNKTGQGETLALQSRILLPTRRKMKRIAAAAAGLDGQTDRQQSRSRRFSG